MIDDSVIRELVSPQLGITAAAFAVAGFALKELISIFRKLVADVDSLHDRILTVEIRAGIVPEQRHENRGHEPERRGSGKHWDREIRRSRDTQ